MVDSGLSIVGAEGQDTGPVLFPTFPVATPNPLVRREDLTPVWSSNAESHDSESISLKRAPPPHYATGALPTSGACQSKHPAPNGINNLNQVLQPKAGR